MLRFEGCTHFRQRVVCATLTGSRIKISNIRANDEQPGLRESEASFLRLIEKVTNGCSIEINETGTEITYKPGFLIGGTVVHDCGKARGIGYFLEALVCLAPFGKAPLNITLTGITNHPLDLSVDMFRTVTLPLLLRFGLEDLELKIAKRGAPPEGGGMVVFKCAIVKTLKPVFIVDPGKVQRIRGIAYSMRMSPQIANRVVDGSKSLLLQFLSDVYIYTDHFKGPDSGKSSGYGLSLVAETTEGCTLSTERVAEPGQLPEDLGATAVQQLLAELVNGGCIDSANQSLALLFMTLCPEDVSKIRLGKLTPYTIQYLRHLRDFFGITFKIKADPESKTVLLSCLGTGFKNLARKIW